MTAIDLEAVIGRLGYDDDDLVQLGDSVGSLPPARRHAWTAASKHVGVDAAYFEGRVPLVYFAGLSIPDDAEVDQAIAALHQRTWNESRAQLVVVVLPTEIRILDSTSPPAAGATPIVATSPADEILEPFTRSGMLRGHARDVLPGGRGHRSVIVQLREDLRPARATLLAQDLSAEAADQLLARSLFAQYLDARGLIAHNAHNPHPRFIDSLHQSVEDTYRLFDSLRERFNGDTFVITAEEREQVLPSHLHVVADLLAGAAGNGQLTLIERYDFRVIPAEVLGGVYEEFVRAEQHTNAAFYTPGHLVDAALDEAMPPNAELSEARVLDPACGSGLFLARAYERLLDHLEESTGRALTGVEMADVLANQIFGCDLMDDALRVAALSCYLVLLDRLADEGPEDDWRFPKLIGANLQQGDFFNVAGSFEGTFEVVASNPPWKRASEAAQRYLASTDRPGGSILTLAQAFFWISLDRLAKDGRMALLMPARSLYNQRPSERAFQVEALSKTSLDLIVDFSAFRRNLFSDAIAPCALYVVRGSKDAARDYVTFAAPKPGPVSLATGRIAIDADQITRIPRRLLRARPDLLRRLIFGDMRDVQLVDRLTLDAPTIGSLRRRGDGRNWTIGLGYQARGGDHNDLPLLREIPSIGTGDIRPFTVETSLPITHEWFHRPRNAALYQGPRVLLGRSLDNMGRLRATFYACSAAFSESVLALVPPPGAEDEALALCAFLNSRLARYLLLMTASSWGIERPEIKQQDVAVLPVAFLDDKAAVAALASLARLGLEGDVDGAIEEIDTFLGEFYELTPDELAVIEDRLEVRLPAFYDSTSPCAYGEPENDEIESYRRTLERTLRTEIGKETAVRADRMSDDVVVGVGLSGTSPPEVAEDPFRELVVPDGTLLIRRPQRTYRRSSVEIRKPAERKQMTAAAALHDSDEIVAEILRAAVRSESGKSAA
jgi:SAM-dependent methyltransferase